MIAASLTTTGVTTEARRFGGRRAVGESSRRLSSKARSHTWRTALSLVGPPAQAHPEPSLLSAVAHDLRTPIAALAMSSELLAEDAELLDAAQVRAMAAGIHRQALWLQGLVENLLCATVLGEGRFEVHPQPIMLGEILQEVRPVVEPLLAQKGQRLRLAVGRANREVAVDWRRIGQVLVNLITNASKYAGRDTPIEVRCGLRSQAVRVTVADRGPGLPVGGGEQLFAAFARGAEDKRSGKEGVGLGLAIVKAIVEAHGGRVGAANRRGGGSSFWFELPLWQAAGSWPR